MKNQGKILIADASAHLRLLYQLELQRAGYATSAAATAQECLAWLERWRPDVLVIDPIMPDMHRHALLAALLRRAPRTALVINTGAPRQAIGPVRQPDATYTLKSANLQPLVSAVQRLGGSGPRAARRRVAAG